MGKLRYFAFCASIFFVASVPAQAEVEFSYDKNTFINYWSCLGIYPGTSLGLGEKVWFFSKDQSPTIGKVALVIPAADAKKRFDALGFDKVYDDKHLWAEIGCAHYFRGDMPESLARVAPEPTHSSSIGFAIRGLPESAWIAGGKGESVAMDVKDNPYVESVRHLVTDACYAPDSLVRVKQFPIRKGRAIVQLDIGKVKKVSAERESRISKRKCGASKVYTPSGHGRNIRRNWKSWKKRTSLSPLRFAGFSWMKSGCSRTRKFTLYGVDERVDTAPIWNTHNGADTTTSAIGFISLNEGKDWDALFVDEGWEGINYSIQRLNDSVVHYNRSLYTYH